MKSMKKIKKCMAAVLCSALLLTPVYSETAVQAAPAKSTTASSEIPQNGWYKLKNGQKKYFKDGKYLVGRQKIGKTVYFFNKNGIMQKKNTTYQKVTYYIEKNGRVLGWKKGKTYYDANGKRLNKDETNEFRASQNARKIVAKITNSKMSKSQKLKVCFDWVMSKYYHTWRRFDQGGKAWYAVNANDHFERGRGNCVADASAFAYLAKVLGYEKVYVCADGKRSNRNAHAWAEINGRVYDPLFAQAKSYSKNYGVSYKTYGLSRVYRVKIPWKY